MLVTGSLRSCRDKFYPEILRKNKGEVDLIGSFNTLVGDLDESSTYSDMDLCQSSPYSYLLLAHIWNFPNGYHGLGKMHQFISTDPVCG